MCHVCGNALANINSLRTHLEARHGILPPVALTKGGGDASAQPPPFYPCHQCGRRLKNRPTLRAHLRNTHGEGPRSSPCEFCARIFCSGWSLRRHQASVHRDQMMLNGGGVSSGGDK
jgi:hypothetical protein